MLRSRSTNVLLSISIWPISFCLALTLLGPLGCGGEEKAKPAESAPKAAVEVPAPAPAAEVSEKVATPDDLPLALVLGLAQFAPRTPGAKSLPQALPATMEFLVRRGGEWEIVSLEDPASNVIHKAMAYPVADDDIRLLAAAGSNATLKLWRKDADGGYTADVIWEKDFGGKFSRMRDVEVADLFGDGQPAIAVATHDQGVVAIIRPDGKGGYSVEEVDQEPNTFVHEIEIGDLDGDGVLEVYSTPSEPNRLDGSEQSGRVTRYVPAKGEGRVVVADLGSRHAKEIYVGDVDGDGRDELYVVVEGKIEKGSKSLIKPVEIRRYEADTAPDAGAVVASIKDRLARFLTVGDIDGDGEKEMVIALFSQGLWLLEPGDDPNEPWVKVQIDADSGGFEHAAILTDLDGNGIDELYVASDNDSEVRRYVWVDGKPVRDVIYKRTNGNSVFTWNIMPVPVALVPGDAEPASDDAEPAADDAEAEAGAD